MPLASGTRLGPYEIQAAIGAGGMGEVYKARDTRLDRTVAIKILPAELSADPDRRVRFEREARAVAALSHPHICTLHDIGSHDGTTFLVMEYLAGESLAERLLHGPLPIAQALDIGAQIAEALDAAHKHGIIHRDLKPGNVMLTTGGAGRSGVTVAKLLDFGLAKLAAHGERPAVAGGKSLPTQAAPVTAEGTILGTLQYMAPEQLEGREADARTDLWALGAILFEMVTGRRAFAGESQVSLIGNIMNAEPASIAAAQPLTPPSLERLVKKCLAKHPDGRWDTAHDVADELRWIASESRPGRTSEGALPEGATAAAASVAGRRRRFRLAVGVVALVTAVAAASVALTWFVMARRPAPPTEVRHVQIDTRPADGLSPQGGNVRLALNRPIRTAIALTPDGSRLVFAGAAGNTGQLFVRDFREDGAKPIPGTDGANTPFLSPDGRSVGFHVSTGERTGALKQVPLDGGPALPICEAALAYGASWGDDGAIVFSTDEGSGLWRVPSTGGRPEVLTTPAAPLEGHFLPHVLPGSRAVVFTVGGSAVALHRMESKASEWEVLVRGASDARYLPTGHLIYARDGVLMAVPFDLARLKITGDERGVVADVMQATNGTNPSLNVGASQVSVSATGTLAYVAGGPFPPLLKRLVWLDRRGQIEPLRVPLRRYFTPRVSRDGKLIAVYDAGDHAGLFMHDPRVPDSLIRVTRENDPAGFLIWAQDGSKRLVFGGESGGLFWARTDPPQQALEPFVSAERGARFNPASWTPDGRLLCIRTTAKSLTQHIWLLSREGAKWAAKPLLETSSLMQFAQVSPDGQWLAYTSTESGRPEVYVRRFPSLTNVTQVSTERAVAPLWSRDGCELFYLQGTDPSKLDFVVRNVKADGSISPGGRVLFNLGSFQALSNYPVPGYDVTPDGRQFVFTSFPVTQPPPPPREIRIIEHWFEELKAKVPTTR